MNMGAFAIENSLRIIRSEGSEAACSQVISTVMASMI
jgi:hypothetical protein